MTQESIDIWNLNIKKESIESFLRYRYSPDIMTIFFHFLRQNKINIAFSVGNWSRGRRLYPSVSLHILSTNSVHVHARFNFRRLDVHMPS